MSVLATHTTRAMDTDLSIEDMVMVTDIDMVDMDMVDMVMVDVDMVDTDITDVDILDITNEDMAATTTKLVRF